MHRGAAEYNEAVALLHRNELRDGDQQQRDARDLEHDLTRLLLLSRDAAQRDQMIQAQAVRCITTIAKHATGGCSTQRLCTAILCNLAASARGRLSASSCDRWGCVSHRHNCPLAVLLHNTVASSAADMRLRELSAAALLSFSVQSECQLQLDLLAALPPLLQILHDARDNADVRVFVAAALWNLTKSPLLMLKLETVHGVLREQLMRRLTDALWTALEPFRLSVTPTGERGTSGLLESDTGDNLGVMLAASASTQLSTVLRVENYVGRPRSLLDQFRAKTPLRRGGVAVAGAVDEGQSVAHFDASGVLVARSCAVCGKKIKLGTRRRRRELLVLACARDGCEQTFHAACSRWKTLSDERRRTHAAAFHCAGCARLLPGVHYCDFLAENAQHELLLTETRFKSVGLQRVVPTAAHAPSAAFAALLDRQTREVVAVGVKTFRVTASSQDMETFVVAVRYVRLAAYAATQQQTHAAARSSPAPVAVANAWTVSYARDGAAQIPVVPGRAVFWPGAFLQDVDAAQYTQRPLAELAAAFVYEFQGDTPQDQAFAIGPPTDRHTAEADGGGLWTALVPRRALCVKLLAEQIGHHKQLRGLPGAGHATSSSRSSRRRRSREAAAPPSTTHTHTHTKKARKPPLGGRRLTKVAIASE